MVEFIDAKASSVGSVHPIGIIGAGMAGLTLALALHRNGRRVVVIEARSRDQVVTEGAFLTLAPNGLNALRAVGLFDRVASLGVEARGFEFYNERGRRIGTLDFVNHRQRFGAPSITLKRGDLSGVLLAACLEAGIELRFDTSLATLQAGPDGVTALVGDHSETFDMLVGADGLRSRVRSMAFAGFPEPAYSGLGSTAGVTDVADATSTMGYMRFVFGRQAFFGYLKMGDGPVFWFDTYNSSEPEPARVSDPEQYGRRIAALHGDDPLDVPMIARAPGAIDRQYPIYDVPDLPRWHEGRIVLIGDAAHAATPHSGQGASMAIEDAVVLAAALQAGTPLSEAFARYEGLRRPRTDEAIRAGRRNGSQKVVQSWLALRVRDLMLPFLIPAARRAQERLYLGRIDLNPCRS